VKITIKNLQKKIPINPKRIKETILKALSRKGAKKSGVITVCFVNDKKIKALNLKYLHKTEPTDVLAFDLCKSKRSGQMLADIVISTDTATRNSKIFHTTPLYELYLYLVHATLHLLGFDDRNFKQRKIMDREAANILAKCQYTGLKR
jgi:probable rRNA maturation factor